MKNHKKLITKIAITATFATSLVALAPLSSVLADDTGTATTQAAALADSTSTRKVILHKFKVDDLSKLGDRGNGEAIDTTGLTPYPGIEFTIQKVERTAGGAALTDPLKQTEGTDYTKVGDAQKDTTDDKGEITFTIGTGTTADGIYLVTETANDDVATPADPFFVYLPQTKRDDKSSLLYEVNVYPKNVSKTNLNPHKTVRKADDNSIGTDGYSINAGDQFQWIGTVDVPNGLYYVASQDQIVDNYVFAMADGKTVINGADGKPVQSQAEAEAADPNYKIIKWGTTTIAKDKEIYADWFGIDDMLNPNLTFDGAKLQYLTPDADESKNASWVDLSSTEATIVAADKTAEGTMVKADLTQAGMKTVAQANAKKIRIVYTTTASKGFNGEIKNQITPRFRTPGIPPVEPYTPENKPDEPTYPTGGFDILKEDEANKSKLAGAEFKIALSEADAQAGKFVQGFNPKRDADGSIVKDAQGNIQYEDTAADLLAISDKDGHAEFNGLMLDVTLDKSTNKYLTSAKDYWVIETKAPDGYELLKTPQKVSVDTTTADDKTVELTVENKPKTDLPFTGGEGTTILIIVALGAISIGTAAVVIDKKRREA